jgi:GNAT superfamily N-acetyltransferase
MDRKRKEGPMDITIRPALEADADECGRICYEAFRTFNERHGYPPLFPSVEAATQRVAGFIRHPAVFAVVAEANEACGRIVGSNFLSERDPIRAIGPITIDPTIQRHGIGRRLMEATLERARGARGVRLLQETYNVQSLSLYAALGFDVKELFVALVGTPTSTPAPTGWQIRPLAAADMQECQALHESVHGHTRTNELRDALATRAPIAAIRGGRVRGYTAMPTNWLANHSVAETEEDMQALLLGAARLTKGSASFLLPVRHAALFRWCLAQGFRASRPLTLMAIGEYREPRGSYSPSVLY